MKKPTKQKQQTRQSRRKFIKNAGLASAAFTIVPRFAIGGKGFIPPSDTLYLAGIGVGGKGRSDLSECAKSPNVKVVHLCDVDDRQAVRSKENFPDAKYHKDFRKMLEKEGKSIDAVTVSTPDHTHAIAALTAMQMGKHVYVQKPLTWSITEARMLAQAAEKYKVVTQMGNQGGSGDGVRKMKEIVDAGLIGDVTKVQSWTNRPIWPQGIEKSTEKTPIPDGLDWDLWLGPAEFTEFQNVYAPFGWRGWFAFGTGALGDMACHILDPAFRILPIDYPSEVECSVVSKWDNSFKEIYLPDSFPSASALYFKFPVKNSDSHIELTWMDGGVKPERPAELGADEPMGDWSGGIIFEGTKGKIMADCYGANPRLIPTSLMDNVTVKETLPRVPEGHYVQWVNACMKGYGNAEVSSPFHYAGPLTESILLGSLAVRTYMTKDGDDKFSGRKKLLWDAKNMAVTNCEFANNFVKRNYREGWKV
ncbi:MAG: Gfo/Idh/MocA family oxidoreductase [Lewinella sp.]|nr:Gfo/Idh/MocA family oxidoreductase [Lewinella sp.]